MTAAPASEPWRERLAFQIHDELGAFTPAGGQLIADVFLRYARLEGVPLSTAGRNMVEVCRRVANNNSGTAEPPRLAGPPRSLHADDELTTHEAALLLGFTREWVGVLARRGALGPTRVDRGRRMVSRAEVLALRADRAGS